MKFNAKIYAMSGTTADKLHLQGDSVEIDTKKIAGKDYQETLKKWQSFKDDMIDSWVAKMHGQLKVRMLWNGKLVAPKGLLSSKWRSKIAKQIDIEPSMPLDAMHELHKTILDNVSKAKKGIILKKTRQRSYAVIYRKKTQKAQYVVRDKKGRFVKQTKSLKRLLKSI